MEMRRIWRTLNRIFSYFDRGGELEMGALRWSSGQVNVFLNFYDTINHLDRLSLFEGLIKMDYSGVYILILQRANPSTAIVGD